MDLALYSSNNLKNEIYKNFKNSRNKDPLTDNFNSITSNKINLLNMQPSSCERSKISTIDSLNSRINYNLKDFSENLNFSKDYSNLKFSENKKERSLILKENIKALKNQLAIVNNSNKYNFDKIIINDNYGLNENINPNIKNSSFFEQGQNKNNYANNNINNQNNNVSNFGMRTSILSNLEEKKFESKMKINKTNNTEKYSNSQFESERENEDYRLNTIYESCNSPKSNSLLDKILFENEYYNDNDSNLNELGEGFALNDFQTVRCENKIEEIESDEALIEVTKNSNELRTKILNLNLDFFKVKSKNKQIKVKNVIVFYIFIKLI